MVSEVLSVALWWRSVPLWESALRRYSPQRCRDCTETLSSTGQTLEATMKLRNQLKFIITISVGLALLSSDAPRPSFSFTTSAAPAGVYDVKTFGAKGDGKALDTAAINKTIDTAAAAGGGTVYFPAGNYLSVSIHLKSNIALYLDQGSTIIAANTTDNAKYDPPEPNEWDKYQDFGHTHWHNSW